LQISALPPSTKYVPIPLLSHPALTQNEQILLHPYVYAQTADLLAYHAEHNIVTEAYSALIPLTKRPGGPVDKPLKEIGERRGVSSAQVLFAWTRAKGAVVVT
jgi:diketogulonate reductase-like aldo/keto reductase